MITVSRLEPSKRPQDFLDIAERVAHALGPVEFVWVGEGNLRKGIVEEAKDRSLSHVSFPGRLDDNSKDRLFRSSDVYISTSESEGFALTVGEAFLRGLPCVVYDLPVYSEVYDDFVLKVRRYDTVQFAETVVRVLRNPEEYAQLVQKAAHFVRENYSYKAVGSRATSALVELVYGRENRGEK